MKKRIFSDMRKKLIVYSIILTMLILNFTFISSVEATAEEGSFTIDELPYNIEFVKVSAGTDHTLAIDTEGNLWTWGVYTYVQSGTNNVRKTTETPIQIKTDIKFKEISAGYNHSLAIDINGNLWAWGNNSEGQLGDGTTKPRETPIQIKSDIIFESIATGYYCSRAIDAEGNLWSWGDNGREPTQIETDTKFKMVSSTYKHSLAIDTEGNLWSWGDNSDYQLGDGTTTNSSTPKQIDSDTTFKSVAAGWDHSLAIDIEGNLWDWGYNHCGQLGYDGGTNYRVSKPKKIDVGTKLKSISAGYFFSLAIDEENDLYVWGSNQYGRLGLSKDIEYMKSPYIRESNVKSISAGAVHTLIITEEGSLFGCGNGGEGELGIGTEVIKYNLVKIAEKRAEYTVTFMNGAETVKTETVIEGEAATAPELTKEGYTLTWDTDFSNVTSDLTVRAIWTANTNTSYKVEHYKRNLDTEVVGYELYETENLSRYNRCYCYSNTENI